jgi:hypothetical protein
MHSSLMSSVGIQPEVTPDNMGHARVGVTQKLYNKTWWEERVEAASVAAASVWRELSRGFSNVPVQTIKGCSAQAAVAVPVDCCFICSICSSIFFFISFVEGSALWVPIIQV